MIDFRHSTEAEKREYKEQSKALRRERYAIKKGRVITIKQKVNRAIEKIHAMRVTRFERLISEQAFASGLTRDEKDYLIRKKHYEQVPLVPSRIEERELKRYSRDARIVPSIGPA
jgi:glyoxylate carboligase